MRQLIEQVLEAERFRMLALAAPARPILEALPALSTHLASLRGRLGVPNYNKLAQCILRHVFLIELVEQPGTKTTKFRTRWISELTNDPRGCSYDECLEIATDLIRDLATGWLDNPLHAEGLQLCFEHGLLPYEAPIDYLSAPAPGDTATRIHQRGNISWTSEDVMLRTLRLRRYLTNATQSPDAAFFTTVLSDKIKVKTYLTDRAQTGLYKTNREKRWETHPHSGQFATRRDCMAIEYALIEQLCRFESFPSAAKELLYAQGLLSPDHQTFRCPITLEPLSFAEFRQELRNRTHGESRFQVGHLNPLKLGDPRAPGAGHTADNISWTSEDGNRIQGSLSLTEVRQLLTKIARNYERNGLA